MIKDPPDSSHSPNMRGWSDVPIETISDATLMSSARKFQRALQALQRHGDGADLKGNGEVEEIREGLRAVKAELQRRGLATELLSEDGTGSHDGTS